jgi:hypothetical protein
LFPLLELHGGHTVNLKTKRTRRNFIRSVFGWNSESPGVICEHGEDGGQDKEKRRNHEL